MTSEEILRQYFDFYGQSGHKQVPNVSLVPAGDSTLLFVNSGMFPLVPYLSGEPHPLGKRLMNVQRSMRFEDIEEIGDNRHTTAFHMLGNWSLGDYFKKEQLPWVYEFFIEKLGLSPERLFASIFAGDENAPRDDESIKIIQDIFKKHGLEAKVNERIFTYGKEDNWWQRGEAIGELGGPDSEIFYYMGKGSGTGKNPAENQDEFIEIGNSVFMQYQRTETGWQELPQKNVDFGGGLERIALVVQEKQDIFETDNFLPIIRKLETMSGKTYRESIEVTRAMRILADHIRAATLLAMDGVLPTNKDQGYALRRFLRRMVSFGQKLGIQENISSGLVPAVNEAVGWLYPDLKRDAGRIREVFNDEEERFRETLRRGQKTLKERLSVRKEWSLEELGQIVFDLRQSHGLPFDISLEEINNILKKSPAELNDIEKSAETLFAKHQEKSRLGAEQKFKGGLADHSREVVRYHTATHLLHQALRSILGSHVQQYGSNITKDRLRFDFSHPARLTDKEVTKVEKLINETIEKDLPVQSIVLPRAEAEKMGALHFFKEKYTDRVSVYFVGPTLEEAFSKEFCGGPHVKDLSELSPTLKIYKQENVGKGIRRIYAKFGQ